MCYPILSACLTGEVQFEQRWREAQGCLKQSIHRKSYVHVYPVRNKPFNIYEHGDNRGFLSSLMINSLFNRYKYISLRCNEPLPCPRWSMLKQWMLSDGSLDAINVEEKYVKWCEQLRTDKYTTAAHMHHVVLFGSLASRP